jgi:predicted methyltransferase
MQKLRLNLWLAGALFAAGASASAAGVSAAPVAAKPDPALASVIADPARKPEQVARDKIRHPLEELTFFGLTPRMTVVELWPGGGYWTDILGPYLAAGGHYYVSVNAPGDAEEDSVVAKFQTRIASEKQRLGPLKVTVLGPGHFNIAPPGSADMVLTFRNLHNWMDGGFADDAIAAVFKALKPGGIFGIEEHRGRTDVLQDPKAQNGYVRQDYTVALVEKAGFKYVGKSEINANPRDTKDYPKGVWTLPPSFAEGDKDKAKYAAIGEADNYVLKFRKP